MEIEKNADLWSGVFGYILGFEPNRIFAVLKSQVSQANRRVAQTTRFQSGCLKRKQKNAHKVLSAPRVRLEENRLFLGVVSD